MPRGPSWVVKSCALLVLLVLPAWKLIPQPQASLEPRQVPREAADPSALDSPYLEPEGGGTAEAARAADGAGAEAQEQQQQQGPERSYYLKWIQEDVAYWGAADGITQEMVDEADAKVHGQCGGGVRMQVVGGRVYAKHHDPGDKGFYPAEYGRGWVSGKGRVPYIVLAMMDVLQEFPGQIPDLDIVLNTGDFPCSRKEEGRSSPPVFSFNGNRFHADLPWPDYSYWGHEIGILDDDEGHWLYGWDAQLDFLSAKWTSPLRERQNQIVWRGRHQDGRDFLRRKFLACPGKFYEAGNSHAGNMFNVWKEGGEVDLKSMCRFRFQGYLESKAWSTNFKQKMACGALFTTPKLAYYEFFTRALRPGEHYLEFDKGVNMCEDVVAKIDAVNAVLQEEEAKEAGAKLKKEGGGGAAGAAAAASERRMLRALRPLAEWSGVWQPEEAALPPVQRRLLADGRTVFAWNTSFTPQQIADNGRKFLQKHVRLRDAKLYLRDVLREYAAVQKFAPKPQPGSVCYTGKKLIDAFGIPHKEDGEDVDAQFPWLRGWGSCEEPGLPAQAAEGEEKP